MMKATQSWSDYAAPGVGPCRLSMNLMMTIGLYRAPFSLRNYGCNQKRLLHLKESFVLAESCGKKRKAGLDDEGFVDDYESDSSPPHSPVYVESGESTFDNDGEFQLSISFKC
jgi:hypothetical protein